MTHHQAVVGGEGPTNHMALLVDLDGELWIADAGLGEGFWSRCRCAKARSSAGPFTYTLTREPGGTWWMGQHEWSSFSGFRMQPEISVVATSSRTTGGSLRTRSRRSCGRWWSSQPRDDRIVTLRSRTLSEVGPWVDTKRVLSVTSSRAVLADVFGISLGGARLERLWDRWPSSSTRRSWRPRRTPGNEGRELKRYVYRVCSEGVNKVVTPAAAAR